LDAAIFAGLAGLAMALTGREIGGAICLAGSTLTFAFLHWLSTGEEEEPSTPAENQKEDEPDWHQFMQEHDEWERKYFAEEEKRSRTADPFA
jgi:hypothetical protein